MLRTIEAIIDKEGNVHLLEEIKVPAPRRVLVTILDEKEGVSGLDIARLSEDSLAADWCRPEEEEAWTYLQPERKSSSRFRFPTCHVQNFAPRS